MLRPHRKSIHIPEKSAKKTQIIAAQKHERKQTATKTTTTTTTTTQKA
jgi:hypothetical protein